MSIFEKKIKVIIKNTINHLLKENVILYPTDTSWGIGGDSSSDLVVRKIFKIKQRNNKKALICLVSSIEMLKKHVKKIPEKLINYINSDNPTTVIFENPKGFSPFLINSDNTVALRVTKNKFCKELIENFGKPIISTSANISGEETPFKFESINKSILNGVDFIVPLENKNLNQKVSRIIKLNKSDNIEFIRK